MPSPVLFGISVAFGLAVWGAVAWHYIWPALRERASPENLKPILLLHGFRFLGLAFIVPGVVSPELPAAFAQPVAYGDQDRPHLPQRRAAVEQGLEEHAV